MGRREVEIIGIGDPVCREAVGERKNRLVTKRGRVEVYLKVTQRCGNNNRERITIVFS